MAQKDDIATRAASANVLGWLAQNIENMIVASADLSNSDKTDGFLKYTKAFTRGDFSGAFLQAGVAELTMAAIANGIALHGGVVVACGTFFVFSDYMKPAVRLAALMGLPVKYIWTHDAFRVGEDGPTHQPVEQEAQIRLMEKLKNHHGHNSMLVLRPADVHETTVSWKLALENTTTPTALLLTRQNVPTLPAFAGSTRLADAAHAAKGAYIIKDAVNPDVILIANGSEVSTQMDGAQKTGRIPDESKGCFSSLRRPFQATISRIPAKSASGRYPGIRTHSRIAGESAGTGRFKRTGIWPRSFWILRSL